MEFLANFTAVQLKAILLKDLSQVLKWIEFGDSEPDTITDANFVPNRLVRLYTRRSAAYKGLSALLLRYGGCYFLTGFEIDTLKHFEEPVDIHHTKLNWIKSSLEVV